jgi:hypothetical protein
MSIIAAPMYASQLVATVLRRPARFIVTPKGVSANQDSWLVFRRHLQWFALVAGALVLAFLQGNASPLTAAWVAVTLLVCLAPILQWRLESWWTGRRAGAARAPQGGQPALEAPLRTAPTPAPVQAREGGSVAVPVELYAAVAAVRRHAGQLRRTLSSLIRHGSLAISDSLRRGRGLLRALARRPVSARNVRVGKVTALRGTPNQRPASARTPARDHARRRGARRRQHPPHVHVRRAARP